MSPLTRSGRRVVVTGLGIVCCLGTGTRYVWEQLLAGKTGITAIQNKAFEQVPSKVAGFVPHGTEMGQFHSDLIPGVEGRAVTTMTQYCLAACNEALTMSGWKPQEEEGRLRTGVCIGTGMVPMEEIADAGQQLSKGGYRRISPWFIPRVLINMAAGHVSLAYGFKGPSHSVSTACTTGLHAIGDASRFIQFGDADVMIAGGCEASVTPLGMAGFARMRALSTNFNSNPEQASRPFDKDRDGFVMSEGAAVLVLEELEHARSRNAPVLAEVLGYGLSCDANHVTAPCKNGDGARRCMEAALRNGGISFEKVGHINCHATSTPLGDAAESQAIVDLFGDHSRNILVTSTKGATGHLLGASGSIESAFTVLACQTGHIPPTVNLVTPSTGCNLNHVIDTGITWDSGDLPRIGLSNSFGFGGTNGTLIFSQFLGR